MTIEIKFVETTAIQSGENEQRMGINDEKFQDLCNSIRSVGILQPIIVTCEGERYQVVAGHRRLKACKYLNVEKIPCKVIRVEESNKYEVTFAENYCRSDLTPVEQACAIKDVLDAGKMTVQQVARTFRRSENWVRAQVAMVGWPADVLEAIHNEVISVTAAANLAMVEDEQYRKFLLQNAADNGATARTTAAWLQAWRTDRPYTEAVEETPATGERVTQPMVPQAPCLCCSNIYRTDELSHVPICVSCIKAIRSVGLNGQGI